MEPKTTDKPTKKNRRKKVILIIIGIIFVLIVTVTIVISALAGKNVKAMNRCVDSVLNTLKTHYAVIPIDAGEYSEMTIKKVMKFHVEQYKIEELGNLSIMRVNMGFMQMATIVITPHDKNMPLLSADFMYILGKRKAYLEFYDVVETKDESYNQLLASLSDTIKNYDHLENITATPAWYADLLTVTTYKGGSFDEDEDLIRMLNDNLAIYLTHAKNLPALTAEEKVTKLAITTEYTDGLIEKGGISTDFFKNEFGNDKTKHFFDHVFFGTKIK